MRAAWLAAALAMALAGAGRAGSRAPEPQPEPRVVRIVAERFSFTPSRIRVPAGAPVELRIRSADTQHGFRIVGGQVNVAVPKRRQGEAVVRFEALAAGSYRFECSRLCGAGHHFMRGEIVAVEAGEAPGQAPGEAR